MRVRRRKKWHFYVIAFVRARFFTHDSGSHCLPHCQERVGPLFIPAFSWTPLAHERTWHQKNLLIRGANGRTLEEPDPFIKDKQNRRVSRQSDPPFDAPFFHLLSRSLARYLTGWSIPSADPGSTSPKSLHIKRGANDRAASERRAERAFSEPDNTSTESYLYKNLTSFLSRYI